MEEIWIYLGKVAVGIMVFHAGFRYLFREWKNFRFNRIYLLGSMVIPFLLPLITFTIVREAAPGFAYATNSSDVAGLTPITEPKTTFSFSSIMLIIYLSGMVFFLMRLLAGHLKAMTILKKSQKQQMDRITLYIYQEEIHPFAFFSKIVIPRSAFSLPAFPMILQHETVHVRERHWVDNLLSEIICAIQWFNPFAWLMKKAIKTNLEFQADEKAVTGFDAETYQMALVSMANKEGIGSFLTAINSSDLKTRIKMMNKKTGNKFAVARQLAVFPLLAILVMGLAGREVKTVILQHEIPALKEFVNEEAGSYHETNTSEHLSQDRVKGKVTNEKGEPLSAATIIIKGSTTGTITDNKGNYEIITGQHDEMLIFGMNGYSRQEIMISGREEINVILQPDMDAKGEITLSSQFSGNERQEGTTLRINRSTKPLYIVNHVEMDNIDHISPDRIESISVLKENSAIAHYGEKGKNGAVIITLKGALTQEDRQKDKPLILVNGFATDSNINDINPEDIESINVLKGSTAVAKYGELAKEGAIEITLKGKTMEKPAISNIQQLRRHIAYAIKYPAAAQQAGQEGKINLYAEFDQDGNLARISETEPGESVVILDEVVVVSYRHASPGQTTNETLKLLMEESKRVVRSYPKFDIPEFKGKWVKMQFNFLLQ